MVKEPLANAASTIDAGQIASFDSADERQGSKIIKSDSEQGKIVRAAVASANGTQITRVKNTYQVRIWVDDGGAVAEDEGFTGAVGELNALAAEEWTELAARKASKSDCVLSALEDAGTVAPDDASSTAAGDPRLDVRGAEMNRAVFALTSAQERLIWSLSEMLSWI